MLHERHPIGCTEEIIMKKKYLSIIFIIALLVLPPVYSMNKSTGSDVKTIESDAANQQNEEENKTDRFIIKYKNNDTNDRIDKNQLNLIEKSVTEKAADSGTKINGRLRKSNKVNAFKPEILVTEMDISGDKIAVIELTEYVDPDEFIKEITNSVDMEKIEYIQPDYKLLLSDFEEADEIENNVSEENADDNEIEPLSPTETDEPEESESPITEEVIVAVIDTGIDTGHEGLSGRFVNGYDFVNNNENVYNADLGLEQLHGTHISGVISKTASNVRIMPLKVFEGGTAYTSNIIAAIAYAEENGASIVNCSWGSTNDNQALRDAMEQSPLFFVCAVGNNRLNISETPIYPAAFGLNNIISVAALNQDFGMSYFSNYGTIVDIAAIGRNVESTYLNNEYGLMSGTSVAAGYVSGAAALYAAANGNEALKYNLKNSADKLSCLQNKTENGNALNIDNLMSEISGQEINLTPEDDFDVFGYEATPSEAWELFSSNDNIQVASGSGYSLFLKGSGVVWKCGDSSSYPQQIAGLTNVIAISASRWGALALKMDGTVYYWSASGVPQEVSGLSGVKAISSGGGHNLALKNNGTVWGWGENNFGQAGESTLSFGYGGELLGYIPSGFYDINSPKQVIYFNGSNYVNLTNISKISAELNVSFAISESGEVYKWGRTNGDYAYDFNANSCYPRNLEVSGIKAVTALDYELFLMQKNDNTVMLNGIPSGGDTSHFFSIGATGNVKAIDKKTVLKNDGTIWYVTGDVYNGTTGSVSMQQDTNIDNIKQISYYSSEFYMQQNNYFVCTLALKNDGTVWGWGDNRNMQLGTDSPDYIDQPVQIGLQNSAPSAGNSLINEYYDDDLYMLDQSGLEEIGWSEYENPNKSGNNWESADSGEFSAESGQLEIVKTGSTSQPSEAANGSLVYAVDKTFTYRKNNWGGNNRVSVWRQNFKGKYAVVLKGAFNHNNSQVYYDILGFRSNGTPSVLGRYKVNSGTSGKFSVYNNGLNGGNTKDYHLFENPRQYRTIRTELSTKPAKFQTFVDGSYTPAETTVTNANPNSIFDMTDWNPKGSDTYIKGIRISAQKQSTQNDVIARIEYLKLLELQPEHDITDDAISALSIGSLTQTPDEVTSSLNTLPTSLCGADITWSSSNTSVLSNTGEYIGNVEFPTKVTMTAKITNPADNFTQYMEFKLILIKKDGFGDKFSENVTGTSGQTTFSQLPGWTFSYPGLTNGANGQIHDSQIKVENDTLKFIKISDRQTASYNECLVGLRALSNTEANPLYRGKASIAFKAKAYGTGTFRISVLSKENQSPFLITLDASVKNIKINYGEEESGVISNITQTVSIDPTIERDYLIDINTKGTFSVKIDGNTVLTENDEEARHFVSGINSGFNISKFKACITNITFANTEIGNIKDFIYTEKLFDYSTNEVTEFTTSNNAGDIFDLAIKAGDTGDINTKEFILSFNKDEVSAVDLVSFIYGGVDPADILTDSKGNVLNPISYNGIKFVKILPELIIFTIDNEYSNSGNSWGGTLNIMKFKAKTNGVKTFNLYVDKV